jgi:acyl carrier protein
MEHNYGGPTVPQEREACGKMIYVDTIRQIVVRHGNLSIGVDSLKDDSDLYLAGLTSLATVNVMLALENFYDIEFPDEHLGRMTFSSFEAIAEAVAVLKG